MQNFVQKAAIKRLIERNAFRSENVTIENVNPKEYQGVCIRACYNAAWNRFENVNDWAKYCLVPYCQINADGEVEV